MIFFFAGTDNCVKFEKPKRTKFGGPEMAEFSKHVTTVQQSYSFETFEKNPGLIA